MAENINIAGRLHSTATGNVVAGANEIYDDTKGKKQSVVNQETDAALDDRYPKSQTYNKTELNSMITTPNQEYVSVTATDQTTAATDVLPATGAADKVYRVGNWDGTQYDETCYSEYAWNGSAYVHLSTKIQIGEVFDISAYHATGGTLATYSDLNDALNGTNGGVPQSLRKGGMSVKFVHTSDNKYVHYTYLGTSTANADFLNPDNWQGVDEEPVAFSKNLVESNAVYEVKELLEDNLNEDGYETLDVVNYKVNLYPTENGYVYGSTSGFKTRYIRLHKGYTYIAEASVGSRFAISSEEPANGVSVSQYYADGRSRTFTVSDDCYLGISNPYDTGTYQVKKIIANSLAKDLKELGEELSDVADRTTVNESLINDYSQTITETKKVIEPLAVGKTLYYKFTNPVNIVACIGFFDSSDALIGSYIGQPSSSKPSALYEGTVQVPQNATYLKAATTSTGFTIDALYYTDSICKDIEDLNKDVDAIEEQIDNIKDKEGAYTDYGQTVNSTSILINPVKVGKTLFYEFIRPASTIACIGFFDSSDNLIGSYIGNTSTSGNTTKGYRGTVVVPQNAVYLKAATGGNGFVIDHLYYTDSLESKVDVNSKKLAPYISLVASDGSTHAINSVLFTTDDVNVGQEIFYSVRNIDNKASYIALFDANNTRLAYYGIGSAGSTKTVSGTFLIPNGFSYAVVNGNSPLIIFYLRYRVNDNPTNNEIDLINNKLWRNNAWLDNRLANPLHTSREKFNEDNQGTPIVDETAMSRTTGISELRIPVSIVTNSGTTLVAATASADGPVEHGETSIDVARKPNNDSWSVQRIFEYGETYGQFWNLSLVIDRTGAHGTTGRIYIFSACGKGNGGAIVPAAQITYENADLLYSYSDDDGVTWSSPTSLKSLWTADQYDMVTPAPNAGIQLTDGTLVIPLFNLKDGNITSGIMYKKPNGNWTLSSSVPTDYTHGNECVAVEVSTNVPTLFIRNETEKDYNVESPNYIHGIGIQIWEYSFTSNSWTKKDSDFIHSTPCQFSIIKCNIDGNTLYLQSGIAGNKRPARKNPTVWASLDCMTWIRVYRIYNGSTVGYSSLGEYNGKLVVSYELGGNYIKYQDISEIKQLILDSVDNYINYDITIQDRIQMLYDKLNGVD